MVIDEFDGQDVLFQVFRQWINISHVRPEETFASSRNAIWVFWIYRRDLLGWRTLHCIIAAYLVILKSLLIHLFGACFCLFVHFIPPPPISRIWTGVHGLWCFSRTSNECCPPFLAISTSFFSWMVFERLITLSYCLGF